MYYHEKSIWLKLTTLILNKGKKVNLKENTLTLDNLNMLLHQRISMFLVRLSITFKNYLITKGSNFEHLHTKQTFTCSNATIGTHVPLPEVIKLFCKC